MGPCSTCELDEREPMSTPSDPCSKCGGDLNGPRAECPHSLKATAVDLAYWRGHNVGRTVLNERTQRLMWERDKVLEFLADANPESYARALAVIGDLNGPHIGWRPRSPTLTEAEMHAARHPYGQWPRGVVGGRWGVRRPVGDSERWTYGTVVVSVWTTADGRATATVMHPRDCGAGVALAEFDGGWTEWRPLAPDESGDVEAWPVIAPAEDSHG